VRIAVLGVGGVGSVLAAFLRRVDRHEVVAVARGEQCAAIREHGLRVDGLKQAHAWPRVVGSAAELRSIDLLLLSTKTFSTLDALADVNPREVRMVASLQNGVLKDQLLARHFGWETVIGCTTMLGGERLSPGVVRYMLDGETFFGELDGGVSARVREIGDAFQQAELPFQLSDNIRSLEWTKQVLQAATAPLSALLRLPLHQLYRGPAARLYYRIVLEAAAVAAAEGVDLDAVHAWGGPVASLLGASEDEALRQLTAFAEALEARGGTNIRVSMLQDLDAGRPTEIEETAGHVVSLGRAAGVATPYLDFACQAVRAASAASANQKSEPSSFTS
jgi:2-dehydropantoate 2-reductase